MATNLHRPFAPERMRAALGDALGTDPGQLEASGAAALEMFALALDCITVDEACRRLGSNDALRASPASGRTALTFHLQSCELCGEAWGDLLEPGYVDGAEPPELDEHEQRQFAARIREIRGEPDELGPDISTDGEENFEHQEAAFGAGIGEPPDSWDG